jgi:hypothetical protein
VASGNAIRGSRVGAGPMGEAERGETWDCPRCGFPAGQDQLAPPSPPRNEPYKTHLAYVKERRSDADGQAILDEALEALRKRKIIR